MLIKGLNSAVIDIVLWRLTATKLWARFYSSTDGLTLDYVQEIDGKTLTI
jgi:hypothetical protein